MRSLGKVLCPTAIILLALSCTWSQQPPSKPAPKSAASAAADSASKPPDYSQEALVFDYYRVVARFENDGTGTRETTTRIRVQSEAGVQQMGQLVFGYNSANEEIKIGYVRVIKADGTVVTAPADAVQDLSSPIERDAPMYTDYRQKHVTVPALRPGEVLEYRTITTLVTPLAPGNFWMEYDFEKNAIVLEERLTLDVPRARELKLKYKPEDKPAITEAGDRKVYVWTSSHKVRESDEEAKKKRKKRPSPDAQVPSVQMTTFKSWEEVGRWYAGLEADRIAASPEITSKASDLAGKLATEQEKIQALYDFVAPNFRYVSISLGLGRYQPHSALSVLMNQYGDCKDKHTLLAALLKAEGLRADAALMNSSRKIDLDIPSPSQFDHVITAVPTKDGLLWMDSTTEVAPYRLLSPALRGKQALLIDRDGTPRLVETPLEPPFPNRQEFALEGKVSDLGKLTAHLHYSFRGDPELYMRAYFRRIPETQWKKFVDVLTTLQGLSGDVTDLKVSDAADTRGPLTIDYDLASPSFLDWSRKKSEIQMLVGRIELPSASGSDGDQDDEDDSDSDTPAATDTKEPIKLYGPLMQATMFHVELPASLTVRAPVSIDLKRDYGSYVSSYKVESGVLTGERRLNVTVAQLPRERERDYSAFTRALRADQQQQLQVESSSSSGTPVIPDTVKVEELVDAANAALHDENYETAINLYKKVVEREPKNKKAWNNLGLAYLGLRKLEPAVDAFKKQIELNPYDQYAYNNLGRAYWAMHRNPDAATAFQRQLEVNPLDQWAHSNLGGVYLEDKNYAGAATELEKAVSISPQNAFLYAALGRAYLNLDQNDNALKAFDRAVELSPTPTIWNDIAYELTLRNVHLDRAEQYAESSVTTTSAHLRNVDLDHLQSNDLNIVQSLGHEWDTLGWVLFQKGDLARAEKLIRAAWELEPICEVGDHLGQIYEKQGRKQDAIHIYTLALAATQPKDETRKRLAALIGGDARVDAEVKKRSAELVEMRTLRLGKLADAGTAEFFLLFSRDGVPDAVKFISGTDKLKPFSATLQSQRYQVSLAGEPAARLVRRGVLDCAPSTGCTFVLTPQENVLSVN